LEQIYTLPGTERTWRTYDPWRLISTAGYLPVVVFSEENPSSAAVTNPGSVATL
jgi:hypothetical protein